MHRRRHPLEHRVIAHELLAFIKASLPTVGQLSTLYALSCTGEWCSCARQHAVIANPPDTIADATPEERLSLINDYSGRITGLTPTDATPEERMAAFRKDGLRIRHFVDSSTPEERMVALRENGSVIVWFADWASAEERLQALCYYRPDGDLIEELPRPWSSEERMRAVKTNGRAIAHFVSNATAEERMAALRSNGRAIEFLIGDASPQERMVALEDRSAFVWIWPTATPNEIAFALNQYGGNIFYILQRRAATPAERLMALTGKDSDHAFYYLGSSGATHDDLLTAFERTPYAIRYFAPLATPEQRLSALRRRPEMLQYLPLPWSLEERMTALSQDGRVLSMIFQKLGYTAVTSEERMAAMRNDGKALWQLFYDGNNNMPNSALSRREERLTALQQNADAFLPWYGNRMTLEERAIHWLVHSNSK